MIKKVTMSIAEKKYNPAPSAGPQTITDTATITCLTDITQGNSDTSRVGDTLTVKSIQWRFWCAANSAGGGQVARFMIVQWYPEVANSSSSPFSVLDILQPSADTEDLVIAPYFHDGRNQFRVLADRTIPIPVADVTSKIYKGIITSGLRRNVNYYAGSSTNGNNQIFLIKLSNKSTNSPTMSNWIQVNFIDS